MIGIVTQPLGYNYGGILQNYALQSALRTIGFDSVTIDVGYGYSYSRFVMSRTLSFLLNCFGAKRPYPAKPFNGRCIPPQTGSFIQKNIRTTRPYSKYTKSCLEKYKIDTVIVGSDQVWRPMYNESIGNMFLDFVGNKCRKIAYGASFGVEQWEYSEEETSVCQELIKSFYGVSVREQSGVALVKNRLKRDDVELVLDPTLLLNKKDYENLCADVSKASGDYICAYVLDSTEITNKIVGEFSSRKRMTVKKMSAHKDIRMTVEEWLACIRDASFVVTDSFHGMVFAIMFNRNFLVVPNRSRGIDRFLSLLSLLGLTDRLIVSAVDKSIDWPLVNQELEFYKERSYAFLRKCLY